MVKSEFLDYQGPFPSQEFIDKAFIVEKNYSRSTNSPLIKDALEIGLGGPSFLKNSIFTKLGYHIGKIAGIFLFWQLTK